MLRLLERNIAAIEQRLVLLAPPQAALPDTFQNVTIDSALHRQFVRQMQLLRGTVYLHEGHLHQHQLSADGLHVTAEDERSWHLLMTDRTGHVSSCAWYLEHENTTTIDELRVRNCPLARQKEWSTKLKAAVEHEIRNARRDRLRYAEVGGWAVSKARRCSSEALMLALAAYGLSRHLGGALGITTANMAHNSSSILRRIGGSYLEHDGAAIPAYYEPKYQAKIELLRFDSRRPNTKFAGLIELLMAKLCNVSVISNSLDIEPAAPYHIADAAAHPLYAA